jgi:hypothetical protein
MGEYYIIVENTFPYHQKRTWKELKNPIELGIKNCAPGMSRRDGEKMGDHGSITVYRNATLVRVEYIIYVYDDYATS